MFRSNWGYILAGVGVILLAAVLAYSLYPEQPDLTGNSGYQEEPASYSAGGADCDPHSTDIALGRERFRDAKACQEAKEEHRLKANDLIQQRRSADAAEASSIFAFQQTRIAAWGIALGFITMAAAIAAAAFAREAARQASLSNIVAKELAIPKINLNINNVMYEEAGKWIPVCFGNMVNVGNTTAHNCTVSMTMKVFDNEHGVIDSLDLRSFGDGVYDLSSRNPQKIKFFNQQAPMKEDIRSLVDKNRIKIIITSDIRFIDFQSKIYNQTVIFEGIPRRSGVVNSGIIDCSMRRVDPKK